VQFCSDATMVRRDIDVAVGADGKPHTRAVVIVDEAHRVRSARCTEILSKLSQKFQFVYLLLLTGTPYRLDGRGLADVASTLVEAATPRQLMGLAPFTDGSTLERPVILSPRYISKPVGDGDAEALLSQPQIVGDVVGTWLREACGVATGRQGEAAGRQAPAPLATICRAYTIAHSRLIVDRFAAALAKAQAEMTNPGFDCTNPHFRNRYASLAAVRNAVVPVLAKNGIAIMQNLTASENGIACETILAHSSGQSMRFGPLFLPASKADAQGFGSAATYARRYSLMAVAGVAGDEDDDANAATGKPIIHDPRGDMPAIDPHELARTIDRMAAALSTDGDKDSWTWGASGGLPISLL
jgi:hypothetical protein